ncbi:TrkH-domain-containing protein [Coniophora puteana RWD-64-598 SS2]|uniref:Potassium transport protein n=1 Tax=Coniophora puteana (strain RWD-64-598) TaxID=741705 RepID=A0A5M3MNQ5_CONPW|nr:TrkH-domain-containing protein [Coniophora puteana RWD-64-598 SS2]EIW80365.1 TrkH-domain-containing protein [Coniophora puteana RWD-64-598 SS2]
MPLWRNIKKELNFFRIHVLFFTFTPLIFSVIFYLANGEYKIAYIDALFQCVTSMTVCGLTTINLSSCTPFQQALLFMQMCIGSPIVISWVTVCLRRHYFAKKFDYIIEAEAARRAAIAMERRMTREATHEAASMAPTAATAAESGTLSRWSSRLTGLLRKGSRDPGESRADSPDEEGGKKVRTDMIRRTDEAPKLINPSGWITEGSRRFSDTLRYTNEPMSSSSEGKTSQDSEEPREEKGEKHAEVEKPAQEEDLQSVQSRERRISDPGAGLSDSEHAPRRMSVTSNTGARHRNHPSVTSIGIPRTSTIEFAPAATRPPPAPLPTIQSNRVFEGGQGASIPFEKHTTRESYARPRGRRMSVANQGVPMGGRNATMQTYRSGRARRPSVSVTRTQSMHPTGVEPPDYYGPTRAKDSGFGGFPLPHIILGNLINRLFPKLRSRFSRTMTIPMSRTYTGTGMGARTATMTGAGMPRTGTVHTTRTGGTKEVAYISFDAIVGRNSTFHWLTNEQLEELGGVEYRALNALLWIVAVYHLGVQLISFIVIAPYVSQSRYASVFVPPNLFRKIAPSWFSVFQVVSAYTNSGYSLVDQSMIPFQTAYPMIFFIIFCILAGNTAFPVFLRFFIWVMAKLTPRSSRIRETLHFLLDHPRRCFIYLFPSHQTWFLFSLLVFLNSVDWFCFMVLDIGNTVIDSIPLGTRFVAGLLQAAAVRMAGFTIITLSAVSPAVKVMYVLMMYVSVYPIAMSVRSTNVYESQSLGVWREEDDYSEEEDQFAPTGSRMQVWGRYLALHARRQLAFDMWWLGLALVLVCIIERGNINDVNASWFDIFPIVFELVSAYGTVGLSLGIPTENYSLSGAFHPLSKLIVCIVMLRGRHRGLPVAIDRAVMLPSEFKRVDAEVAQAEDDDAAAASLRERALDIDLNGSRTNLPNGNGNGTAAQPAGEDSGELRRRAVQMENAEDRALRHAHVDVVPE